MPPAKHDLDDKTRAFDVENSVTGKSTVMKGKTNDRDTLENELKDKYFYDLHHYDYDESQKDVPNFLGRLRARFDKWKEMGASGFIQETLEVRLQITFY